jgi:orotidine-5'-phosphate decarboxylase
MAETFRSRLAAAIDARGPLCAGIDPSPPVLERWRLDDSASGATQFALRCIEAVADVVAAIKPNAAFFEQYGAAGMAGFETVLAAARDAGVLTIADAKRGDIESTNIAYARAWLSAQSPMAADAVTVAPYLGVRAMAPYFDTAEREGRGVFVVVRSSNREGRDVQLSRDGDGRTVETSVLNAVAARPEVVGAVIGLMAKEEPLALPESSFYLVPGLWTQGATLDDLTAQLSGMGSAPVVVNLSRSLAEGGPDPQSLREVALRARGDIRRALRPTED